jgi:hypothetical protein
MAENTLAPHMSEQQPALSKYWRAPATGERPRLLTLQQAGPGMAPVAHHTHRQNRGRGVTSSNASLSHLPCPNVRWTACGCKRPQQRRSRRRPQHNTGRSCRMQEHIGLVTASICMMAKALKDGLAGRPSKSRPVKPNQASQASHSNSQARQATGQPSQPSQQPQPQPGSIWLVPTHSSIRALPPERRRCQGFHRPLAHVTKIMRERAPAAPGCRSLMAAKCL